LSGGGNPVMVLREEMASNIPEGAVDCGQSLSSRNVVVLYSVWGNLPHPSYLISPLRLEVVIAAPLRARIETFAFVQEQARSHQWYR
jgi:hypothetical protein